MAVNDSSAPGAALLLEPRGFALLNSLATLPYTPDLPAKLRKSLEKKGIEPELIAAVLTQLQLRHEARGKLGEFAAGMLFTRRGLEQATRLAVAGHHAERYRRAGCQVVADLGCGLGVDSLALAGLGIGVRAFEIDETTAAFALMNLRAFAGASVTQADVTELDIAQLVGAGVDGVYADPARRDARGRVAKPEAWSPPLATALGWAAEVPGGRVGVKVAPGIDYRELPGEAEVEWVSVDGEAVEAGIWLGDLRREGPGRGALVLRSGAEGKLAAHRLEAEAPSADAPAASVDVQELGRYLFDPDPAVIRAGALSALAGQLGAGIISPKIAYLTADALPSPTSSSPTLPSAPASPTPFAQAFEVVEVLPLQEKALRAELKRRGIGKLEIMKRGADLDPATLRKKLKLSGEASAALFLTRLAGKHQAILAQRA